MDDVHRYSAVLGFTAFVNRNIMASGYFENLEHC